MNPEKNLTSFCGLYCRDCIPSKQELFRTVERLENMLSELHFDEYAKLKAEKHRVFKDYSTFVRVLQE